MELAIFIAQYYSANLSSVLSLFAPFKECDLVGLEKIEPILNILSQTQTNALKELQKHSASLLFGDTGSGKTEIYMHAIAQTLEQKKALYCWCQKSLSPLKCNNALKGFLKKI